jgi:hypothetical protein
MKKKHSPFSFFHSISITIKGHCSFGKELTLFIIAFIITVPIYAQRFDGGLLAGFNGSQVRGHLMSNGFNKLGILAGAWVQTNVNDNFYWNFELKFSQKGFRINPTVKNGGLLYIYRLDYIDMPVAFGYQINEKFSIFGGLSINYLISKSAEDNYSRYDVESGTLNWETALFTGLKVNFYQLIAQEWAKNFRLDIRYQFSAIPIYNTNNQLFYYSPYSQYNSVISTALYYKLGKQ